MGVAVNIMGCLPHANTQLPAAPTCPSHHCGGGHSVAKLNAPWAVTAHQQTQQHSLLSTSHGSHLGGSCWKQEGKQSCALAAELLQISRGTGARLAIYNPPLEIWAKDHNSSIILKHYLPMPSALQVKGTKYTKSCTSTRSACPGQWWMWVAGSRDPGGHPRVMQPTPWPTVSPPKPGMQLIKSFQFSFL